MPKAPPLHRQSPRSTMRILRSHTRTNYGDDALAQVSERKPKILKYGQRTARIYAGDEHQEFVVHEDLLCQTPYFRARLQPHRKPPTGRCPLCKDALHASTQDLTYCQSPTCGTNIHTACMKAREKAHQRSTLSFSPSAPLTCPQCRTDWLDPGADQQELYCTNLDAQAFTTYIRWLYSARIPHPERSRANPRSVNAPMIALYKLGGALCDTRFLKAVLSAWVEVMLADNMYPGAGVTRRIYEEFPAGSPVRWMLVEMYATKFGADWWEREWGKYPKELVKDVLVKTQRLGRVLEELDVGELKRLCCSWVEEEAREKEGEI